MQLNFYSFTDEADTNSYIFSDQVNLHTIGLLFFLSMLNKQTKMLGGNSTVLWLLLVTQHVQYFVT
jgi:hypothetical protein